MWTFIFGFMGVSMAIGVGIGIILFVGIYLPMAIYSLPYLCWIDGQKKQYNIPKKLESETWIENLPFGAIAPHFKYLWRNTVNATKLYHSWITKKPHGITKF